MAQAACRQGTCRAGRRYYASPDRWRKAAQRALDEGVVVRQVNDSGLWVANSGTQAHTAYTVSVQGGIAYACSCPAGENNDPVCKHRAAFYLHIGALVATAEPVEEPGVSLVVELAA